MRLLSYYLLAKNSPPSAQGAPRLGALTADGRVMQLSGRPGFPAAMLEAITSGLECWELLADAINKPVFNEAPTIVPLDEVSLAAPLPNPASFRDFYAFEKHVVNAHRIRGKTVPPEWYQHPVFYFSNHHAIYGPGEPIPRPSHSNAMDFEMEVACIIGKAGTNIRPEEAEDYIFGYTILNDWSARDTQREESRVGLGPAKGKDFATSIGPWIVSPDELADRKTGRPGVYDLQLTARLNGEVVGQGNWAEIYYSFGEMIAKASDCAALVPGDLIGSGTVGNGCLLEITCGEGPWLEPGDTVEIEVEKIGVLSNPVVEFQRDQTGRQTLENPPSSR